MTALFSSNVTGNQIKQCRNYLKPQKVKFEGGWILNDFTDSLKTTLERIFIANEIDVTNVTSMKIKLCSGYDAAGSFKLRNGKSTSSTHVLYGGFRIASISDQNGHRIFVEKTQAPDRYISIILKLFYYNFYSNHYIFQVKGHYYSYHELKAIKF